MNSPKDMFEQFVLPGHILLYPVRRKSSLEMRYGVIDDIEEELIIGYDIVLYRFVGIIHTLNCKCDKLIKRNFISFNHSVIISINYFNNKSNGHNLIRSKSLEILKNGKY